MGDIYDYIWKQDLDFKQKVIISCCMAERKIDRFIMGRNPVQIKDEILDVDMAVRLDKITNGMHGEEIGSVCNRDGCQGVIIERREGDGCSCHTCAPCPYCCQNPEYCPECGWRPEQP